MRGILIDDHGEYWSENAPVLRSSFAPSHADEGLTAYLVRNLGFIAVDQFGPSCQIRYRPSVVTARSLQTLATWLNANKYARIALNTFDDAWRLELCGDTERAMGRIQETVELVQRRRVDEFLLRPRALTTLSTYPKFGPIIDNWDLLTRQINERKLIRMISEFTDGRFVLVAPDSGSGRMILKGAGSGYKTLDKKWALRSRGTPLDEQPDPQYGRWLEDAYADVLKSGQPALQDVDAIVSTPEFGRYRLRYTRVVLPCRSEAGSWLLSTSLLDDRVDLRSIETSRGFDVRAQVS